MRTRRNDARGRMPGERSSFRALGSRQTLDSAAGRYACMRLRTHRAAAAAGPRGQSLRGCCLVPAALTAGAIPSVGRGLARARLRAGSHVLRSWRAVLGLVGG